MKADAFLVAHHELLRRLIREVDATTDPTRRRKLIGELSDEVHMHAQIEDEIFYPRVREVSPLVPIAHAEHRVLADQLAAVVRNGPAGPRFEEEWYGMTHALEHHAGEEETEMFPESHHLGEEELERLGAELEERLEQLRRSRVTRLRLHAKRGLVRRT